jgi:hypothetical protein
MIMKYVLRGALMLGVLVLSAFVVLASPVPASSDVNLLGKMKNADWRALNIFFSNFCESSLGDFSADSRDDKALIAFAVSHNVINNRKLFKEDAEGRYYIGKNSVDATIEKYFGIKGVKHQSAGGEFVVYENDRYYWDDVCEGSPGFAGAQAVALYDDGDGTFSAIVELYKDNHAFQIDVDKFDIKDFYAPKKSWKGKTASYYDLDATYSAKIAPHVYGGKKTWELLEWHADEAEDEGGE